MPKINRVKTVIVRAAPRISLFESRVMPLQQSDGAKIMTLGHTFPPHHNRQLHAARLAFARDQKPDLIIFLGGFFSAAAFDSIMPSQSAGGVAIAPDAYNLLHTRSEAPEVEKAREFQLFEDRVEYMGKSVVGAYLRELAEAAGCSMIVVPSVSEGTRGWRNDHRIFEEKVHLKKQDLDGQSEGEKNRKKRLSDPSRQITRDLAEFLGLPKPADPAELKPGEFLVLHPNGGLLVNEDTLFIIGKRALRQPGMASMRDLSDYTGAGSKCRSIVRAHDGKVAENFGTITEGTVPDYRESSFTAIECGHGFDKKYRGDLDDYDYRSPGFVFSRVIAGQLDTQSVPEIRGADGIYRFVYDGKVYATESADTRGYSDPVTVVTR